MISKTSFIKCGYSNTLNVELLERKIVKKAFRVDDAHKKLCSALRRICKNLYEKLLDAANEEYESGFKLVLSDSSSLEDVIKTDNIDGLILDCKDDDDIKERLKETSIGDEVTLELGDFDDTRLFHKVLVETKEGLIGYLQKCDSRFYEGYMEKGEYAFKGKVIQVNPEDDYVKISIEIDNV